MPLTRLRFERLDPAAILPRRAHAGDGGLDLYSIERVRLGIGDRHPVRTGLAVEIPLGYVGYVIPRSGMAARDGISIVNAPGLIDSGYRGELMVLLLNTSLANSVTIEAGERIAQLVISAVELPEPVFSASLTASEDGRDAGGFGSSGRSA